MIKVYAGNPGLGVCATIDAMHRDRKRIFVDLLKWDVPVIAGEFESDQFDTAHAVYLIDGGQDGEHCGSIRLLPTDRPHLLGSLFAHLCDGPVPNGDTILEITRGCLSPRLAAAERRRVRNRLISGAVSYGLRQAISHFTCVADSGWLRQISALGWECRPLGAPRRIAGVMTGALQITLTSRTVDLLRADGIFADVLLAPVELPTALAA